MLLCRVSGEADLIEQLGDAMAAFGSTSESVRDQGLRDDRADSEAGIEGRARVLEDRLEISP
jgi:hypothetical protein